MERRDIPITDVAKLVRAALRKAFPGVAFSVRSQTYSMGCHLHVSWTDGPSVKAVERITDPFHGTGFDGMTDSTTHHDGTLNGETVRFAGSRPSCSRTISQRLEDAAGKAWEALSADERGQLLGRVDFPGWPEDRPGYRLAIFISVPQERRP